MTIDRKKCMSSKKCNNLKYIRHGIKSIDEVIEIVEADSELMEYWTNYIDDIYDAKPGSKPKSVRVVKSINSNSDVEDFKIVKSKIENLNSLQLVELFDIIDNLLNAS